jgi:hypothetical protein
VASNEMLVREEQKNVPLPTDGLLQQNESLLGLGIDEFS